MTNEGIAKQIVAVFEAQGFPARIEIVPDSLKSAKVFVGAAPEHYAFLVFPSAVASARIDLLRGHMAPKHFSREDGKRPKRWAEVKELCERIVVRLQADAEARAEIDAARAVVADLRALGLPALVVSGRVSITLDFSPEYAREMGPKLLAVLGERKASS